MEDVLVLQHDPVEGMGTFTASLDRHHLSYRGVRLFADEELPEEWPKARAIVILGGQMGVHDEERYPFLRWEKALVKGALNSGTPLLGICLGARLIATVAGSDVYAGDVEEMGWYPVTLTTEGQFDPLLGRLPEKPTVFQWHREGFELPPRARRLAFSASYGTQAFRLGRNVYGLQFHLEVTPAMVEEWIQREKTEFAKLRYILPDKIRADTRSYAGALRRLGERFISDFVQRTLGPKRGEKIGPGKQVSGLSETK